MKVSSLEAHGVAITQKSYIKSGKVAQGKKGYLKLRHAAHSLFTEAQGKISPRIVPGQKLSQI